MKVLFIASGNRTIGISPIVENQKASLIKIGIQVDTFPIEGKGLIGYLKMVIKLTKFLKFNHYDLVHAHYSYSGFVATLAGCKPLVVSLMGSDTKTGNLTNFIIKRLNRWFWSACIVKSEKMRNEIKIKDSAVIPNGINFKRFYNIPKSEAQLKLKYNTDKKHILFAANPDRSEKNYPLAQKAILSLNRDDLEVHLLKNIPNEEVVLQYCASDLVLLTSKREGSPNVIKEAMACNMPIVSTDVGDVSWIFGTVPGCFLSPGEPSKLADTIVSALSFAEKTGKTTGRERLTELGLESETIAKKIYTIYQKSIKSINND